MKPVLEATLVTLMALSVPLILIVFKWRQFAYLILYFEMLRLFVESMVPMKSWNTAPRLQAALQLYASFICFYTGQIGQVLCVTLLYALLKLVIQTVLFKDPLSSGKLAMEVLLSLAILLMSVFSAVLSQYV